MIPALQSDVRTKFNKWIFLILIFMTVQTLVLMILSTECPLYPYNSEDAGGRFKIWLTLIFVPLSQAIIDYGLVFISCQVLRSLLPYHTTDFTFSLVGTLSFLVTFVSLLFKFVDTRYDMLIALLLPLFKLFPMGVSVRDSMNSAYEFRNHLINDRVDVVNQSGKLVTLYRLNQTFV